jgi:hypothetical protein
MPDNEDKGFKVIDRRGADAPEAAKPGEPDVHGPGWEMRNEGPDDAPLPSDFTTFCLSLASATLIHLGESPAMESGKTEVDLPLAKQTIDVLSMLQEKTKGNLTDSEEKLITAVLYDLRMRFVDASRKPR